MAQVVLFYLSKFHHVEEIQYIYYLRMRDLSCFFLCRTDALDRYQLIVKLPTGKK
jgi:hypothetical protein